MSYHCGHVMQKQGLLTVHIAEKLLVFGICHMQCPIYYIYIKRLDNSSINVHTVLLIVREPV